MRETGRIGVDIGGTFTDIVLITDRGRIVSQKTASTPTNPEQAVLTGTLQTLRESGLEPGDIVAVRHGTTVGSNAILQKTGGRTGLVTTRGFRDVLEIGRLRTPGMFDLSWDKPQPLVPRCWRRGVTERIGADGTVIARLDRTELIEIGTFFQDEGIETIAVCFLNSYRNPAHEREAERLLGQAYPAMAVTTSVSVLPEQREYERTSTTVVNAYVLPVMRAYLKSLQTGLSKIGIAAPLLVGNSNGGLARAALAQDKPVFFISSGRAAGVVGAGHLGERIGARDVVAFDMGGTTASASLIKNGKVTRTTEYEFRAGVSTPSRFIKAGGYMMRVPTVDVAEIGNGAGSIAYVDAAGLIYVGPVSAGAEPGPACYGAGGEKPTVTDANLVLGFLPDRLAGGSLVLDVEKARAAIDRDVAQPLDLSIEEAAFGIRAVANANMARAIRAVTVERGLDPRDFKLLAYGGSGPIHACDLARSLDIPEVLFPPAPGVFTAMGMLSGSVEHFHIRSIHQPLDRITPAVLQEISDTLADEATRELATEGYGRETMGLRFEIDLRFTGQEAELQVGFDPLRLTDELADLRPRFLALYKEMYGYVSEDGIEAVNVRLTATGITRDGSEQNWGPDRGNKDIKAPKSSVDTAGTETRSIYFARGRPRRDTPVMDRQAFSGAMDGPLVLESADTTIVVAPGTRAENGLDGSIVVTVDV
ncbi:MAG: hydantoinase/oxoprolinase family protein [Hyphomicrobiales bacterium]|nr:hydantoinase/oxoprolinase family protein [Hyphomicrobiales bacterium]